MAQLEHHADSVSSKFRKVKKELPKPAPAPAHESDEEFLGVLKRYLAASTLPQPPKNPNSHCLTYLSHALVGWPNH